MFKNSVLGWLTLAAATFSLVSCNLDQEMGNDLEEVTFTASQIERPLETKTILDNEALNDGWLHILWEQGDKVGTFGSWTRNSTFTAKSTDTYSLFAGQLSRGDVLKYAYYPYNPTATNFRSVPVSISQFQSMNLDGSLDGNDVRASNSVVKTSNGYDMQFEFMTSYLMMHFDLTGVIGLYDDEYVESYTLESLPMRGMVGDYTLNLANLTMNQVDCYDEVSVNIPSHPNVYSGQINTTVSIAPVLKIRDKMRVTLETNYHKISFVFTNTANIRRGYCYDYLFVVGDMGLYPNELSIVSKDGPEVDPDHMDAVKRELDWQNGAEFVIGGQSYTKASTNLREVYVPSELIVNDATLQNSIVFIEPGAHIFLGPAAALGNTIIMSNDPDSKADIEGILVAGESSEPTYLALYDMNLHNNGFNAVVMDGDGLQTLLIENCDIIVGGYDGAVDFGGMYGTEFDKIAFVGNKVYSENASQLSQYVLAIDAYDKEINEVVIKDNMFINVVGDGAVLDAYSVANVDVEVNHFNYMVTCNNSFPIVATAEAPESVTCKSNTYYRRRGTGVVSAFETADKTVESALASTNPLADIDVEDFTYSIVAPFVTAKYTLDGETVPVSFSGKSATLPHVPSGANVEYYYLPGVTVSESGSWATAKTVTFSTEDASDTYTFTLPDYVAGPVQALAGDSASWTLAWADEFNGSAWNSDAWSRIPVTSHGGIEYQNPDDASLVEMTDGALVTWAVGKNAGTYAAGGVYGKDKKSFNLNMNGVEGRIDVAVKVSDAQGFWPSIWMLPSDQAIDAGTVANGEIDIFSHYHSENIVNQILSTAAGRYSCTPSYTTRDQYHVFTVTVTNEAINMYVDGALTKSVTKAVAGASGWPWDAHEYYLNIAAQIGGWVGNPGADALPAHMDVDYVRYMVK